MTGRLPVSLQITVVLVAVSLIVVGASYVTQMWSLDDALLKSERAKLDTAASMASSLIDKERLRLQSLSLALREHRGLNAAAKRSAATGERELVRQVMDRIYGEIGVSMLYLIGSDALVTYRAHLPERHGDRSTIWGIGEALDGQNITVASKGPLGLAIRSLSPLRDGERIVGAVMVGTAFDNAFAQRLAKVTNVAIAFASAEGVWASSGPDRRVDFARHQPFIAQSLYERGPVFVLDRKADLAHRYAPIRIEYETFLLLVESDVGPALAQLRAAQRQLLIVAGLALACAILLGTGITLFLLRPLRDLRLRALALVNAIAGERIATPGGNEVHSLVRAFDLAAAALSANDRQLREARDAAETAARQDALTGLPNRTQLNMHLAQTITLARRHGSFTAVLYLDLDNFKSINDTMGHESGDHILRQTAEKLRVAVRDSDILCRIGGDEFLVVLSSIRTPDDAASVAAKILNAFSSPMVTGGGAELRVSVSIGVSVFPTDGDSGEQLIRNADAAMYRAKRSGRNAFRYYTTDMDEHAHEAFATELALRKALEREEFRLHYQPQIDLRTGGIIGAEALIRWQHPERGLLAPAQFIGVAEQRGLILPIGDWVIETACRQVQDWIGAGLPAIQVAVNLSALQFQQDDLEQKVRRILGQTRLAPRLLELEITENSVLLGAESVKARMEALRSIGLSLAIDDFGTGYSALGYLKRFRINTLKLDREFVRDVQHDPDDAAIVRAILAIAKQLKLRVVAEGVETEEQAQFLIEHGCDAAQGYYYERPVPAEEFAALLAAGSAAMQATATPLGRAKRI